MSRLSHDRRRSLLARHAATHFTVMPDVDFLAAAALAVCAQAVSRDDAAELLRECGLLAEPGRKLPPAGFRVTTPHPPDRARAMPRMSPAKKGRAT